MRGAIKTLILILFFPIILFAQEYPSCVFLMIYPGARQVGMAGAFSALADDALATYYNPAGLSFQKEIDFSYHHTIPWLPGLTEGLNIKMHYIYSSFVIPITNEFAWGLFFDYFNSGETEVWNEKGEFLGKYTPYDYAVGLSYSYRIFSNLGIGGNIKYIYSFLVPDWVWEKMPELGIEEGGTARSLAFDLGILHRIDKNFLQINNAFVLQNLGPGVSYIKGSEPDPLPYSIRVGSAFKFRHLSFLMREKDTQDWIIKFLTQNSYFLFSFDLRQDLYFESKPWLSFGLEINPISFFSIRLGYFEDTDGWRGGIIVEDENGELECISIFEYLFNRKGRRIVELWRRPSIPYTWSIGFNFKFLKIDFGSDAYIYFFPTDNPRFNISINIGEPIFKGYIL